jgi:hypothetical protein
MNDLQALVYVSTAAHHLSEAEIGHLLDRARERNAKEQVTGVLLYSHGNFLQYLEGPLAGVANVYEHIVADRLHHGIIELVREPIAAREFSDWTMAFRSISAFGLSSPDKFDDLFIAKIDPAVAAPSVTHSLLLKFWNKGAIPAKAESLLMDAPLAVETLEQGAAAVVVQRNLVA